MLKLKEILNEQDNTISAKEWRKVEKTITRGMDMVFDKGVKYLRDYERSNLPPAEMKMLSDFFDNYFLLKKRFQKINKHLENRDFICTDQYTISDIAIWSWYGQLTLGKLYSAAEFLDVSSYKNVLRWAENINLRPAVKRGKIVNKVSGNPDFQLRERHSSDDFKMIKI